MFAEGVDEDNKEDGDDREDGGAGGKTAFQKTLSCAKNVLMSKVISSDKDLVGIILFGTGKSNNSRFAFVSISMNNVLLERVPFRTTAEQISFEYCRKCDNSIIKFSTQSHPVTAGPIIKYQM